MTRSPASPRSLFLGHGAPTLALSRHPATDVMRELGPRLPVPAVVIVASPHRFARRFDVGVAPRFEAWHDFRGFPPELYELRYSPPGAPALAARVGEILRAAGLPSQPSDDARIDHGIWVPLRLMWPEANVPVIPVATLGADPAAHLALGRALKPLADEGMLVIGTGSLTHNLGDVDLRSEFAPEKTWARQFDDWIAQQLAAGNEEALLDYRARAPHAEHAHPDEDHLMPLFVAMGAGGGATPLFRGMSYGTVSLSAYAFA